MTEKTRYDDHLTKLRHLQRRGAPWHQIAESFMEGEELAQQESIAVHGYRNQKPVDDYRGRATVATGISYDEFHRMMLTLARIEQIGRGEVSKETILSDDFEGVELGAALAWRRYDAGVRALLDLKAGKITKEDISAKLGELPARSLPKRAFGEHSHWSGFDENLEMLEFDRLQCMCRVGETVVDGDWNRLVRLARSAGYADADSFLSDCGADGSGDTAEQAARREMYEAYQDGEYWNAIDRSERVLGDAGGEGVNRDLARKVCGLMRDAYESGRILRSEQTPASPSP